MNKFVISDTFADMNEYASYPYTHLYYHGKIVGKAITDNWQFRMIHGGVKYGWLRKAKLNDEFHYYQVHILIDGLEFIQNIIERSKDKAVTKLVKKFRKENDIADDINIETEVEEIVCS